MAESNSHGTGQSEDGEFVDLIERLTVLLRTVLQIAGIFAVVAALVVWLRGGDIRDLIGLFSFAILAHQYGTS